MMEKNNKKIKIKKEIDKIIGKINKKVKSCNHAKTSHASRASQVSHIRCAKMVT